MPLVKVTDGPLFGSGPGTLSSLINMRLDKGGYAEARGGFDKMKPSGGTSADAISAGGFSSIAQISTNYGWIRTETPANVFGGNVQFKTGWSAFGAVPAVNASLYF